jgi:hypothetical protein
MYKPMSQVNDLIGKTFGYLTVVSQGESNKRGRAMWLCHCSCGNPKVILGDHLTRKDNKGIRSCGCLVSEIQTTHGAYRHDADIDFHIRYSLLQALKDRARRRGYDSDLEVSDIPDVPNICPVLGIPILKYRKWSEGKGKGKGRNRHDSSPTIDRLDSNLPYLKKYRNNLAVISWRANKLKSDATIDELIKLSQYVQTRGVLIERESSLMDSKPIQITAGNEAQAETQRERLSEKTLEISEAIV